jgi:hypothetical protein
LKTAGGGFGLLALADLLRDDGLLAAEVESAARTAARINPLAVRPAHFAAKAKRVIWLFMNGGQSQVDTWDYKPELAKRDGQSLAGFDNKTGFFPEQVGGLMKSPFQFTQQGASGTWTSEIFPNLGKHVDDLAYVHPLVLHRDQQPLAGPVSDQYRHEPDGFSVRRLVGDVRAGEREPESARLRGDV